MFYNTAAARAFRKCTIKILKRCISITLNVYPLHIFHSQNNEGVVTLLKRLLTGYTDTPRRPAVAEEHRVVHSIVLVIFAFRHILFIQFQHTVCPKIEGLCST